jgi:hypothetical protein
MMTMCREWLPRDFKRVRYLLLFIVNIFLHHIRFYLTLFSVYLFSILLLL